MFSIANIILGLIGFAGGVAMIYYAFYLNHQVYFLDFVEKRFGGGSGTTAYRLIGLLACIFSMLVIIGRIDLYRAAFGGGQASGTPTQSQVRPATQNNTPTSGSLISQ